MTPEQRKQFVTQHKLCFNCLRTHQVSRCISQSVCRVCRGQHHTKLHLPNLSSKSATNDKADEDAVSTFSSAVHLQSLYGADNGSTMVLGTACVRVQDVNGHYHSARALIDNGSQISIATENLARKLKFPRFKSRSVLGVGSSSHSTLGKITFNILPMRDSTHSLSAECCIMQRITGNLPSVPVNSSVTQLCKDLVLADQNFTVPGPIDLLLGVDLYSQILDGTQFSLGDNMPTAYSSVFGWIIMGKAPTSSQHVGCIASVSCNLDNQLNMSRGSASVLRSQAKSHVPRNQSSLFVPSLERSDVHVLTCSLEHAFQISSIVPSKIILGDSACQYLAPAELTDHLSTHLSHFSPCLEADTSAGPENVIFASESFLPDSVSPPSKFNFDQLAGELPRLIRSSSVPRPLLSCNPAPLRAGPLSIVESSDSLLCTEESVQSMEVFSTNSLELLQGDRVRSIRRFNFWLDSHGLSRVVTRFVGSEKLLQIISHHIAKLIISHYQLAVTLLA